MLEKLAKMQAEALKSSTWVGDNFAEQSRAMHYGEREAADHPRPGHDRRGAELVEEGMSVAPLLFPVAPPDELN